MFGSVVLEVAIGLIFVYLLVSLMVTSATEILAGLRKSRARNLWKGVHNLLDDSRTAETWVDRLYSHPLIQSLSEGQTARDGSALTPRTGPSYIPSRTFALSLLAILREPRRALTEQIDQIPDSVPLADFKTQLVSRLPENGLKEWMTRLILSLPDTLTTAQAKEELRKIAAADLSETISSLPNEKLRGALLALYDDAKGDVDELKKNIEIWFNNSMDRVSGWYKRRTQFVNFGIGLFLVLFLNVDTVLIIRTLAENETLRKTVVAQAEVYAENADENEIRAPAVPAGEEGQDSTSPEPLSSDLISSDLVPPDSGSAAAPEETPPDEEFQDLRKQINALGLPIGWKSTTEDNKDYRQFPGKSWDLWKSTLGFHLLGWIISAFAVSLGAPFWFDTLNRVISIRATGRAPEEKPKSPETVPQPREPGNVPASPEQKVVVEVRGAG